MAHIRRLQLMFILALVVGGLALTAVPYVPQVAGSKGDKADFGRESSFQISFIDDEEIIEQVASSKGTRADAGRESAIASSAGGRARIARESS